MVQVAIGAESSKSFSPAPYWHTIVVIGALLTNSTWDFVRRHKPRASVPVDFVSYIYSLDIAFYCVVLLFVLIGLELKNHVSLGLFDPADRRKRVGDIAREMGIGLIAVFVMITADVLVWFFFLFFGRTNASPFPLPETAMGAVAFLAAITFAGVVEEVLFRGYLQRQLEAWSGDVYVGLILQAALFGVGHGWGGIEKMVSSFIGGLILGWLFLWRRTLITPIAAHCVNNAVAGIAVIAMKFAGAHS